MLSRLARAAAAADISAIEYRIARIVCSVEGEDEALKFIASRKEDAERSADAELGEDSEGERAPGSSATRPSK